jgi:hypothetical protein
MENMPWVFCGRRERHHAHGVTCPGTGTCGNRDTHDEHLVLEGSLAPFWCAGSRIRLYREKHVTTDGRKLLDTVWADEPLPLMTTDETVDDRVGHFGTMIVGMVTAIRRESATGWVTGLIRTEGFNPTGLCAEADFDQIGEPEIVNDVQVITGARLRAVTLGHKPCWDEMVP